MKLRGLVVFFTLLLLIISLSQLSFSYFTSKHEDKIHSLAQQRIDAFYTPAATRYPNDEVNQKLYSDTIAQANKNYYAFLIDSSKDEVVCYGLQGGVSYQKAKESELNLGLDLQGGMSVTMEIDLADMIRGLLADKTNPAANLALENANKRKANSNADFISLFTEEFRKANPNTSLVSIFNINKIKELKNTNSEEDLITSLKADAGLAIQNTFNILRNRIDQFGVAQPYINLDKEKGIITVELAGVDNPERVRKYLQSSANLQFYEVHTLNELSSILTLGNERILAASKGDTVKQKDAVTKKGGSISDILAQKKNEENKVETPKGNTPKSIFNYLIQGRGGSEIAFVRLKDTAQLGILLRRPELTNLLPKNLIFMYGLNEKGKGEEPILALYAIRTQSNGLAAMEGAHVNNASQDYDHLRPGIVVVTMEMDLEGTRLWGNLTKKNVGRPIAVTLDNQVYTAPNVNEPILDGHSQISGNFKVEEAQDLAKILKSGKLPAKASIVQEQVVGPTLGQKAVDAGMRSFAIAFGIIFILMLVYYNSSGWIANIALILNLIFTIGILGALGATLTAPGIAGLVLTIGMAVDTNVIIFERIKEELMYGKGIHAAIDEGYKRSLSPVLDAHVTTLLTAIILYSFGLGPVKGFATTQIIGILLSLFCGIIVSRLINNWWMNRKKVTYFTTISRSLFKKSNFHFIQYRKVAYGISALVLILGVVSIFNGFDEGVEFAGGRSYVVKFPQAVNIEAVRDSLKLAFTESPIIKIIDNKQQLDITTAYLIHETGVDVEAKVEDKLYEGLKPFMPSATSLEDFKVHFKQSSKTVLPTISDDLKRGAMWATFWALLIIALYIFIRFRDWRYSLGTIVSLLHDVLVVLIVFSFCRRWVSFPLEIDQHFIAAILTVIGFSMNDTVIVFDRIREYTGKMKNESKANIINMAINNTLSRTIMTSLTVFLTILVLFLVGGEVTKGFAFAMLIGVITGTYSSIFVAAPILIDMGSSKKKEVEGKEKGSKEK